MNLNKRFVLAIAVALFALIVGCSGSNPTAPQGSAETIDSLPVIGLATAGDSYNAVGLLGAYEVTVDVEEMTAELVSKRFSSIGESLLVSGLNFFTVSPCATCVQITGIEWSSEGLLVLSYHVKHPFDLGDPALPPKGNNRADLDIFDMAFVVNDASDAHSVIPQLLASVRNNTYVMASGYTKELEDLVNHSHALPFYLVVDDSITGTPTWNEFPMGGEGDCDMYIDYQGQKMLFELYLTFGYGASARRATFFEPRYFNPEFNRKNAWKVEITPPWEPDYPNMTNCWLDNDNTTPLPIVVEVYDWQQGANVYAGVDFEGEALLSDVYAASNVASVRLEMPGTTISDTMFTPVKEMLAADSGTGMPGDPLVYTFNVANELSMAAGMYTGFVQVMDERNPPSMPGNVDYLIHITETLGQSLMTIPEFSTYQAFPFWVLTPCGPIDGALVTTGPYNVASGAHIDFEITASSANGGTVILYECDMDYNGTNFTTDFTSTDGFFDEVGPFNALTCPIDDEYTVAFRITDDCVDFQGLPNVMILTETITVSVLCCVGTDIQVWDFDTCPTGSPLDTCEGWSGIGNACGLPNGDSSNYGNFKWGCSASQSCGNISGNYVTSGSDTAGSCTSFITDYGANVNYNIALDAPFVIPSLASYDFMSLEFEHCDAMNTTAAFKAYIHQGLTCGTTGWTELYTTSLADLCEVVEINIDAYAGGFAFFRFGLTDTGYKWDGGSCGNAGVIIDNVKVTGCAPI